LLKNELPVRFQVASPAHALTRCRQINRLRACFVVATILGCYNRLFFNSLTAYERRLAHTAQVRRVWPNHLSLREQTVPTQLNATAELSRCQPTRLCHVVDASYSRILQFAVIIFLFSSRAFESSAWSLAAL
jgi:hypothetical protein